MSTTPAIRDFTNDEVELIHRTIAPNATPQEFDLFLYRCKHMDLDPLKPGEIYFIKYGTSPGTIVVGIEGFRKRAERSGKRSGVKRGVVRNDKGACIGAWCEVYRTDWKESAREEVSLAEYNTGKSNWAKMPETMIKKVAEAAALRLAFPDELGGIYIKEEMEQAEPRDVSPNTPSRPDTIPGQSEAGSPRPANDPREFVIDFGRKYKGLKLGKIPRSELESYIAWLKANAVRDGTALNTQVELMVQNFKKIYSIPSDDEIEAHADGFSQEDFDFNRVFPEGAR